MYHWSVIQSIFSSFTFLFSSSRFMIGFNFNGMQQCKLPCACCAVRYTIDFFLHSIASSSSTFSNILFARNFVLNSLPFLCHQCWIIIHNQPTTLTTETKWTGKQEYFGLEWIMDDTMNTTNKEGNENVYFYSHFAYFSIFILDTMIYLYILCFSCCLLWRL